jgi:amino acid transporter
MGRDRALPSMLGTTHPKFKTPLWATAITAIIALVLFIASEFAGSLQSLVNDANAAIGIQIAFYYGLAAFAVIVIYRRHIMKSFANFFFIFLWPFVGGVFMIYVFLEIIPGIPHIVSIPSSQAIDTRATWLGLGSIVVGLIPMAIYWMRGSLYFKFPTESERTAALVAMEENL